VGPQCNLLSLDLNHNIQRGFLRTAVELLPPNTELQKLRENDGGEREEMGKKRRHDTIERVEKKQERLCYFFLAVFT